MILLQLLLLWLPLNPLRVEPRISRALDKTTMRMISPRKKSLLLRLRSKIPLFYRKKK